MSKELHQTLQMIISSGLYSGICIIAAMICGAYFHTFEAMAWLNLATFMVAIATLEYYLIVQNMMSTVLMLIIHEPHKIFLAGTLLFTTGLIILVREEIHHFKHEGSNATKIPEIIPIDPTKFGILLFMATLVTLLNDHEIWIGAQIGGILFTTISASIAAEKLDSESLS